MSVFKTKKTKKTKKNKKKIRKNLEKSGKTSESDNMPGKVRYFFSVRLN